MSRTAIKAALFAALAGCAWGQYQPPGGSSGPPFSVPVVAPAFLGSGSDAYINFLSNPSHSYASGDLANNGGALTYSNGTVTNPLPQLIAKSVLGSPANAIVVSTIPGTFSNLMIVVSGRGLATANFVAVNMGFNGDTTSGNYSGQQLTFSGSTSSAATKAGNAGGGVIGTIAANSAAAGKGGALIVDIPNYSQTTLNKYAESRIIATHDGSTTWDAGVYGFEWASTSAITQIVVSLASGNFATGASISVYGY